MTELECLENALKRCWERQVEEWQRRGRQHPLVICAYLRTGWFLCLR